EQAPVKDLIDPKNEGLRIAQAAQAAALAARERHSAVQESEDAVVRSRSASFLFDSPNVDERDKSIVQDREKTDAGNEREKNDNDNAANNENCEGSRTRFSIGSFFTKLNRCGI
ncbi:hypothetical protein ANCCAN_21258, partial [Ancylostoma caninum]